MRRPTPPLASTHDSRTPLGVSGRRATLAAFVCVVSLLASLLVGTAPAAAVHSGGIAARFEPGVPAEVQSAVNDVLAEFDSVFNLRLGAIQIAVDWTPMGTLGVGGPVLIRRDGRYYPAAVADARFGGQHAKGPVDGFVTMASNFRWHFEADANVPADRFDFRSAFAHELVHALGFSVHTQLNARGQRVLSGRTDVFDLNLYSGGRQLVTMSAAEQSVAFARDDVWFDVGGGRLIPLNSNGGRAASHYGNAVSPTDTEPGALMYAGLINGVRHELDAAVIGALSRLGFATSVSPTEPTGLTFDGATLRWSTSLRTKTTPPEKIRVVAYRGGSVVHQVELPGAVEQFAVPRGVRGAEFEVTAIDRVGRTTSARVAAATKVMADATSIAELVAASDYAAHHGDVLRLYWAFFNRQPDVDGARYWIGLFDSGSSLDAIAEAFAGSFEFRNRYGNLSSNDDYLSIIYRNVLGRERDNDGFVYWLGLLDNGLLNRGAVVRWIAAANEFKLAHPY